MMVSLSLSRYCYGFCSDGFTIANNLSDNVTSDIETEKQNIRKVCGYDMFSLEVLEAADSPFEKKTKLLLLMC